MATYSLSGTGVQALSANVTAAHVTITTTPSNSRVGTANPANLYDVCLLRFGDATGYFDAVPVVGGPQWLAVPLGATRCAYACKGGAVISFAEVIGGSRPFGGADALSSLSDVALTTPADTQILTYQSSSAKWINANASGGGGADFKRLTSTTLAANSTTITTDLSAFQSYTNLVVVASVSLTSGTNTTVAVNALCNADSTLLAVGNCTGADAPNGYSLIRTFIADYSSTTRYKTLVSVNANDAGASGIFYAGQGARWASLAAITSFTLQPTAGSTFRSGSKVVFYGEA